MPSWKTHLIIAAIFWGIAVAILWQQNIFRDALLIAASFPVALLWGLLPDLDQQNSKVNGLIEISFSALAFFLILAYLYFAKEILFLYAGLFLLAILVFVQITKHRGHIHSLFFAVIVSLPFALLSPYFSLLIAIGFVSHLCADLEFKLF